MPNNLVARPLVPEVLQTAVSGARLCDELWSLLDDPVWSSQMVESLGKVHKQLKNNANTEAAELILQLRAAWARP